MEVKNRRILVLGGAGLVGMAVCRRLLVQRPAVLFVGSLDEASARDAVETLQSEFPDSESRIEPVWGNLFVRAEYKDVDPRDLARDRTARKTLLRDLYDEMSGTQRGEILEQNALFQLIRRCRPDGIVDSINTATVFAYQNIYESATSLLALKGAAPGELYESLEGHLTRSAIPQLVRHIQILLAACEADPGDGFEGVKVYLKIGTSGTGGMGLNIPFTHGEERPSRVLLSKAAVAGAHTLLLFLMGRTPGAPIVKEIKPTAAIAWKQIAHGDVLRRGEPIPLVDCPPEEAYPIAAGRDRSTAYGHPTDRTLRATFVDTGENGLFSANEFKVISSLGLMHFVTPEEIAESVVSEIRGGNTGSDVIAGLDATVMRASYRAGLLRHVAVERLETLCREHGNGVAAFEMLGPPRLSKLLYEAEILRQVAPTSAALMEYSPAALSRKAGEVVAADETLRQAAISVGIPILMPDGERLLRGPVVKVEEAADGWVDLRPAHMAQWQHWIGCMLDEARQASATDGLASGSRAGRHFNVAGSWAVPAQLDPAEMVAWIFRRADGGERIKD